MQGARVVYQRAIQEKPSLCFETCAGPYICSLCQIWFVGLDDEIEPYDLTLNTMSANEITQWAEGVLRQLSDKADLQNDQFIFLAGAKYRKYLIPYMANVQVPIEGLPIGKQLQRLSEFER